MKKQLIALFTFLFGFYSLSAQIHKDLQLAFRIGPSFGGSCYTFSPENVKLKDNLSRGLRYFMPDVQLEISLDRDLSPVLGFHLQTSTVLAVVEFDNGLIWPDYRTNSSEEPSLYLGGKYRHSILERFNIGVLAALAYQPINNPSGGGYLEYDGGSLSKEHSSFRLNTSDIKNRIGCRLGFDIAYQFKNKMQLSYNFQYYTHFAPYLAIYDITYEHPDTGTESYTWYSTLNRPYHMIGFSTPLFKSE